MTVTLEEQRLGALRWIVLSGPGAEAFRALGRHMRAEIRAVVGEWDYLAELRQHVAGPPGRERLAAVARASGEGFPEVWAELAALADGAGVPLGDLALLNFRGDLGAVGEGGGCSDLAWRRRESFIAHNEDDAEFFDGRIVTVEALAGQHASREAGPGGPLAWHTNHGRYLAGAEADPRGTSLARGEVLQALEVPAGEPDAAWFAHILAGAAPPAGVRADSSPGGSSVTLCTIVANLTTGEAFLLGGGTEAVTIPLTDLARGGAGAPPVILAQTADGGPA